MHPLTNKVKDGALTYACPDRGTPTSTLGVTIRNRLICPFCGQMQTNNLPQPCVRCGMKLEEPGFQGVPQ